MLMLRFAKLLLLLALLSGPAFAGDTRVAVATNFTHAARALTTAFERETGHRVRFSFGATGQLYAQISQGAPFDAFLAADQVRPQRAEVEGLAVRGSRFTYAMGALVLYGGNKRPVQEGTLATTAPDRLAIANPATAPYGAAALETLAAMGLLETYQERLVRGTNVAQAYQFIATGNAELGFVALAQVFDQAPTDYWLVPATLHRPIAQDAVLLTRGETNDAARAFLTFLQGPEARAIISRMGYHLPTAKGGASDG
ncbi:molybdate transport system substrate-binding protein [Kordiimonas lacus]|uniref:Molybdate transport system substrate-binding protein n=2 Tax=Kordiimonas lacus TaxID=637679 RepID=A0A1G6T089_9PROT|nr:molybdate transport system substrate-binding protein [Kordiimonas lacus]